MEVAWRAVPGFHNASHARLWRAWRSRGGRVSTKPLFKSNGGGLEGPSHEGPAPMEVAMEFHLTLSQGVLVGYKLGLIHKATAPDLTLFVGYGSLAARPHTRGCMDFRALLISELR